MLFGDESSCPFIEIEDVAAKFPAFEKASKPVIVRHATREWTHVTAKDWTDQKLAELGSDEVVRVAFTNNDGHLNRFDSFSKWSQELPEIWRVSDFVLVRPISAQMRFADFLKLLQLADSGRGVEEGRPYLHQVEMNLHLPGLMSLVQAPAWLDKERLKEVNLWMSPGSTVTSVHNDHTHNVMFMIQGKKEFLLFPPNQKSNLYYEKIAEYYPKGGAAHVSDNHGLVDVTNVNLTRFPRYPHAKAVRCEVDEGDALYVPADWHHGVYSVGSTVDGRRRNIGINFWYLV